MTTAHPDARDHVGPRSWFAAARHALDRPLTSYYLLLVAPALLLTIGLVMVLSASSVDAFENHGDQLLLGAPTAHLGGGRPARARGSPRGCRVQAVRRLAWPGLVLAIGLLALDPDSAGRRGQRQHATGSRSGPFTLQPSEFAKLGVVLWAAHVYANKERALGQLHHVLVPVVPGLLVVVGLVLWQRDLGTALVLLAILLAMLWVVGAPGRLFALGHVDRRGGRALPRHDQHRAPRAAARASPTRSRTSSAPGWQPAHGLYALSSGGWFGEGIGASQPEVGRPARGAHRLHLRGPRRGARPGRHAAGGRCSSSPSRSPRSGSRSRTTDPFVRYASFGIIVWLLGQMMINVGMVLALLPVIGIPLPLVSYGGSALLPSLVALGLLIGFARREPEAARALAARRRRPLGRACPRAALRPALVSRLDPMRILLAGGGTAGHTSPLLATADALRRLRPRRARSPAWARRAASRPASCPRPATRSS